MHTGQIEKAWTRINGDGIQVLQPHVFEKSGESLCHFPLRQNIGDDYNAARQEQTPSARLAAPCARLHKVLV